MIHHLSIGVREPQRVARVLAQLWNGYCMPFPVVEGGWIVMLGDDRGTAIEVTPLALEMIPGVGEPDGRAITGYALQDWEVHYRARTKTTDFSATHLALSSPLSEQAVLAIARREGWRAVRADRGPAFPVIEVWLENRVLVEVLTPDMSKRYAEFMSPTRLAALFGFDAPVRAGGPSALEPK